MVQLLELGVVQDALLTTFAVIILTGVVAFLFSKYGSEDEETQRQKKRRLAREAREEEKRKADERRKADAAEKERQRQERRKKKLSKKAGASTGGGGSGKEKASLAFHTGLPKFNNRRDGCIRSHLILRFFIHEEREREFI